MAIYTKRGDQGATDLFSGERVQKYDPQVEAYGVIDEVNSWLGLVRAKSENKDICNVIYQIQQKLFVVAAELASRQSDSEERITKEDVKYLERRIDDFEEERLSRRGFVTPGESETGSILDIARTVVRRAERRIVEADQQENWKAASYLLEYINRLSDLLYMLARVEDKRSLIKLVEQEVLKRLKKEE